MLTPALSYKASAILLCSTSLRATAARAFARPGSHYHIDLSTFRSLRQKLENQLRGLVGLRQHRDARLLQHLRLRQFGRFGREVRILNGAARRGQVLARRLKIADRRREAVLDGAQLTLERTDRGQRRVDGGYGRVRTGYRQHTGIGQGCVAQGDRTGRKAEIRGARTADCYVAGSRQRDG